MEKEITVLSPNELTTILEKNRRDLLYRIVQSISKAIIENLNEATIFTVTFTESKSRYDIFYEKPYWEDVLTGIIEELKDEEREYDLVLDAYELIEKLKQT